MSWGPLGDVEGFTSKDSQSQDQSDLFWKDGGQTRLPMPKSSDLDLAADIFLSQRWRLTSSSGSGVVVSLQAEEQQGFSIL